jgi:hypothetical protein
MLNTSYHLITPFIPVLLMLTMVVANHVVAAERSDRKTAAERRWMKVHWQVTACQILEAAARLPIRRSTRLDARHLSAYR